MYCISQLTRLYNDVESAVVDARYCSNARDATDMITMNEENKMLITL